jgi:hypothetical protein
LETIIEQQYVNSMSDFVTNLLEEYEMMGFWECRSNEKRKVSFTLSDDEYCKWFPVQLPCNVKRNMIYYV